MFGAVPVMDGQRRAEGCGGGHRLRWSGTAMGCPERWWSHRAWRLSEENCMPQRTLCSKEKIRPTSHGTHSLCCCPAVCGCAPQPFHLQFRAGGPIGLLSPSETQIDLEITP
eukprot:XP_024999405.1 uncharacterized protein LOC112530311 [Gallus gallus]